MKPCRLKKLKSPCSSQLQSSPPSSAVVGMDKSVNSPDDAHNPGQTPSNPPVLPEHTDSPDSPAAAPSPTAQHTNWAAKHIPAAGFDGSLPVKMNPGRSPQTSHMPSRAAFPNLPRTEPGD